MAPALSKPGEKDGLIENDAGLDWTKPDEDGLIENDAGLVQVTSAACKVK